MTVNVTLNNGVQMPALGFGVFQTPTDVTAQAVGTALATGYRLIDTAAAYGNEREAGQAIRHSGLARDDVFIETKIWISDYGYDQTLHAFDKSAGKLGIDRIDLLILDQALPSRFDLTQEAYRALETLFADGRVRAIGVSTFMPGHLDALLKQATVVPAVNQVEVHPYFTQSAVQAADAAHGILTQAWSPPDLCLQGDIIRAPPVLRWPGFRVPARGRAAPSSLRPCPQTCRARSPLSRLRSSPCSRSSRPSTLVRPSASNHKRSAPSSGRSKTSRNSRCSKPSCSRSNPASSSCSASSSITSARSTPVKRKC